MKRGINWKVLIVSLVIVYAIAFLGGLFTSSATDTEWYDSVKPSITPPNWVFPVVWNILFFLIAISLYLAWTTSRKQTDKHRIILIFGINLFLNFFWSLLFFGLKAPLLAFIELLLLELSIIAMLRLTYDINRNSFYLLLPYLVWVGFAGVLNAITAF